jgi:hypothetical protein
MDWLGMRPSPKASSFLVANFRCHVRVTNGAPTRLVASHVGRSLLEIRSSSLPDHLCETRGDTAYGTSKVLSTLVTQNGIWRERRNNESREKPKA